MFRETETGLDRVVTWREFVGLFRRPRPLQDRAERKCWDRTCGRRAFRDSSYCEHHEIEQRLDMYDPEHGWGT